MLMVLVMTMIFMAVGMGTLFVVDRHTGFRARYQKNVAGFYAAEAGLNYGAAEVMEMLVKNGAPTECGPRSMSINGRMVTYQLSGCGRAPVVRTDLDPPFEGLSGIVYTYTVTSRAVNAAGWTEARLAMQFQVHLVPVVQFAVFAQSGGRFPMDPGSLIRGPVYWGGGFYPDGGKGAIPGAGGIAPGIRTISLPDAKMLLCTPWSCPGGSRPGSYWARATLRMVLDTTTAQPLGPGGPLLYPVRVVRADGIVDLAKTAALRVFMLSVPGAITYSDVPVRDQDCRVVQNCEQRYASSFAYGPAFPLFKPCLMGRSPRARITPFNYCNDYRYGGFYNWREGKPTLMLNIDWRALEDWNRQQNGILFDSTSPAAGPNQGAVAFFSVKGGGAAGANNYGVRIYDAPNLLGGRGAPGVTLASDVSLYLVGNYNCSSSNDPTCGSTGGDRPSSIVADSVNLLSCAWIDDPGRACGQGFGARLAGGGGYRLLDERSTTAPASGLAAQQTQVNVAILTGADRPWCLQNPQAPDCGAAFSGGLEQFVRLHENWTGQKLTIHGSLVSLGASAHTCAAVSAQIAPGIANDPAVPCASDPAAQGQSRSAPPVLQVLSDARFTGSNGGGLPPMTPRVGFVTRDWLVEVGP